MLQNVVIPTKLGLDMAEGDDPDALWINARQVAAMLGISTEVVRRLARANKLPHIKIGGSLRFKRSTIENLDELPAD